MTVQEEAVVPWRGIAVALIVGVLWTAFWVVYEMLRTRELPPVQPSTIVELPVPLERWCLAIETNRMGPESLIRFLADVSPDVRNAVLERALAHALRIGGVSGFVPLLLEHRALVAPSVVANLRPEEGGIAALEVFAELYLDVVGRRWQPEVQEEQLQVVYRLLEAGLDEPDAEPALSVRTTAVGLVVRARDRRALPALKRMLAAERTAERCQELRRVIDSLVNQGS